MEMFLMALALSLLGVAVSAALFAAATRTAEPEAAVVAQPVSPVVTRFFREQLAGPELPVPPEALLLEIERHVRLEQAAAESFIADPTVESLHGRTVSRLVH